MLLAILPAKVDTLLIYVTLSYPEWQKTLRHVYVVLEGLTEDLERIEKAHSSVRADTRLQVESLFAFRGEVVQEQFGESYADFTKNRVLFYLEILERWQYDRPQPCQRIIYQKLISLTEDRLQKRMVFRQIVQLNQLNSFSVSLLLLFLLYLAMIEIVEKRLILIETVVMHL